LGERLPYKQEVAGSSPAPPIAMTSQEWTPLTGAQWRQRLPRRGPVDRESMLMDFSRGKRVAHIGFVDEKRVEAKLESGGWLHERLAGVASTLVGLDVSEEGVAWAKNQGYEAHAVDAQSPEAVSKLGLKPVDVVVAGEVIEHLDAPGPFLRAMRGLLKDDGLLVVTTPNAYRLLNFLAPVSGVELIHPDHTAWHSPHTLRNLLERSGWRVEGFAYYQNPAPALDGWKGRAARAGRSLFVTVGRVLPYWSDGIVVWSRPA
jgi:SAM-dependent methyltransferase